MTEEPEIAKRIGYKLSNLRRERGYDRKRFAAEMNINYVALYQWERGVNIKHIVKFFELCKKLGVTPDYFLKD